jgi:DnaJ-class molecular chaperone
MQPCNRCNGVGMCQQCKGTGRLGYAGSGPLSNRPTCNYCEGTGVCSPCRGTGLNYESSAVVPVPNGSTERELLRT